MATLTMTGAIDGTYLGAPIAFSTNEADVNIITGLTATASADQTNWVNGPLTYTIVIDNQSGEDLDASMLSTTLDLSLVSFNTAYGVVIDSSTGVYTFNSTTGELDITLPDPIADTESSTITFQVMQA